MDCEILLNFFCGSRWKSTTLYGLVSSRASLLSAPDVPQLSTATHALQGRNIPPDFAFRPYNGQQDVEMNNPIPNKAVSRRSSNSIIRLPSVPFDEARIYWGSEDDLMNIHMLASTSTREVSQPTGSENIDTIERPNSLLPDLDYAFLAGLHSPRSSSPRMQSHMHARSANLALNSSHAAVTVTRCAHKTGPMIIDYGALQPGVHPSQSHGLSTTKPNDYNPYQSHFDSQKPSDRSAWYSQVSQDYLK